MDQGTRWETGNLKAEISGYVGKGKYIYMHRELQRQTLVDMMGVLHGSKELDERVIHRERRNGLVREEVEYTLANGQKTRAMLLMPQVWRSKLPAVLALHDHGGFYYYGKEKLLDNDREPEELTAFQEQYYSGRGWAEALAYRGYAVLVNDAFYFGTRRLLPDTLAGDSASRYFPFLDRLKEGTPGYIDAYNRAMGLYEREMAKHILVSSISWPGILVSDDMRAVDYLASRPEIDKERIGCCGLSMGGFRSALLSGMDPRVHCAVVAGWMNTFSDLQHRLLRDHTFMLYIPGLLQRFDLPDIAGLCAPNPLMVQQCMLDDLFTKEGMRKAEEALAVYYSEAKADKRLCIAHYDNPHQFNLKMQEDAFDWLDRFLTA